MNLISGPIIQEVIGHWVARGVGPFYIEEHRTPRGLHGGMPVIADLSAAFAFSGDRRIEPIQVFNDEPSVCRQGGWMDDMNTARRGRP